MKLSHLLAQREAILQQARLANLAYAYTRLSDFAARIQRARLHGVVCLLQAAPDADRFWASLTALEGSQSVIDEHFSDDDIMDLADVIAYATGENDLELTFPIEEMTERFLDPLREQLAEDGVTIDRPQPFRAEIDHDPTTGCPQAEEGQA